jgi:3'-phosphoadenosine 5'-phosphosulfate sulfotransferase (PAPS reductase)/FAD synthetase
MPTKTDQVYEIARPAHLDLTPEQVGQLTKPEREARVRALMAESRRVFDAAVDLHITPSHDYLGTALLFSGGNDSTVLAHLFRPLVDLAIHANTGIGIEATRDFVRQTCRSWGLLLDERHAPTSYRELVLERGFPGPGQHFKMFQRLKERGFMQARAALVTRPRHERMVFLAGRRRDESERRSDIPIWEREGSVVWVSPLAYWTKLDLNTYRLMAFEAGDPVPINRVSDLIHMSGECLCGSFAKRGELDEIAAWFPGVVAEIRALQDDVAAAGNAPLERCRWGWGAYRKTPLKPSRTGIACSSCAPPPTNPDPGSPESVAVA